MPAELVARRVALLLVALALVLASGVTVAPAAAGLTATQRFDKAVTAKLNAARTARDKTALRTRGTFATCHDRVAQRAAVRMARTGRFRTSSVRGLSSCPSVDLRVSAVRARTPRAAARTLLRRTAVRRALLSPHARTLAVGARKRRDGTWATVVVVGGAARPVATEPEAGTTLQQQPALSDDAVAMRTAIYDGTNAARADAGEEGLSVHACLEANAQRWAESLAQRQLLDHQELSTVWADCGSSGLLGENVAYRWDADGVGMVDQWMGSDGHRKNILTSGFSRIGVGVAQAADGSWYGVQVFSATFW